jgi:hypothetical protein
MKILILGLGERNPKIEHEEIIWFCNSLFRQMSKAAKTRYLLDIY